MSTLKTFEAAYDRLKYMVTSGDFTPSNFVTLVMRVMRVVEEVEEKGQGVAKKELAISLIKKLIKDIVMSEENRSVIELSIVTILPSLIDGFVQVDRKKLFKKASGCLGGCLK